MGIQRRIDFFEMRAKKIETAVESPAKMLKATLENANTQLSFKDKRWEPSDNKFVTLSTIITKDNIQTGYVSCGLKSHRPDYIDAENGEKRPNQKKKSEGEEEKVHFAVRYDKDKVTLLVETNGKAIQTEKIGYYFAILNDRVRDLLTQTKRIENIVCLPIPIDNVREVVKSMNKASLVELYYDKRILGSDFLNLTDRSSCVKQEVIILIKNTREKSSNIKEAAQDIFSNFGANPDIKRLRISGKDSQDSPFQVDTSFFGKKAFINVEPDLSKGVVNTTDALRQLEALAKSL